MQYKKSGGKNIPDLTTLPAWFHLIGLSALIITPVTILGIAKMSGLLFLLVIFSGLVSFFLLRDFVKQLTVKEILFFISVSLLFFAALVTSGYLGTQLDNANRFLAMVLIVPSYIFYKQYLYEKEKYLWIGLVIGAYIAFGISIYQVYGPQQLPRAHGVLHPIQFGNMALVMGVMSLAGFGWFVSPKKWMGIFPILAFLAGMLASMLSLSRGGWIALPAFGVIFFWYLSKHISLKKNFAIFAFVIFVIGTVYITPSTGVQERVSITIVNLSSYLNSGSVTDNARMTSLGTRLEMWKASYLLFRSNPWTGVGWDQYRSETKILVDKGVVNHNAQTFPHPHNQFLSALAKGGIFAFIGFLASLTIPGFFFYRAIHQDASPHVRRAALAGLLLITGFFCFGISEAIFERSRSAQFFAFYLAVLMSMVPLANPKR